MCFNVTRDYVNELDFINDSTSTSSDHEESELPTDLESNSSTYGCAEWTEVCFL